MEFLPFLKNHPFAVEAFFEKSIVLTFAIPRHEIENLIPSCLQLDVFDNQWGFIAVALVKTKWLRPKGFHTIFGNDFFLIGYRIFVRYKTQSGKSLRGLYIIKSETDKKKMEFFGNIFTHYNYSTTDIEMKNYENHTLIISKKSDFLIDIDLNSDKIKLPDLSPFKDFKEARRYAGPLPFTFTYSKKNNSVLIIEGVRTDWDPSPIKINQYNFSFLKSLNISNPVLANAFEINNVPYYWKKGKIEKWAQ